MAALTPATVPCPCFDDPWLGWVFFVALPAVLLILAALFQTYRTREGASGSAQTRCDGGDVETAEDLTKREGGGRVSKGPEISDGRAEAHFP